MSKVIRHTPPLLPLLRDLHLKHGRDVVEPSRWSDVLRSVERFEHSPTATEEGIGRCVDSLRRSMEQSVRTVFAHQVLFGRALSRIRDKVDKDKRLDLWKARFPPPKTAPAPGQFPHSLKMAEMMIRVGTHGVFGNAKHWGKIPQSIAICDEIIRKAKDRRLDVLGLLERGIVHPGTSLKEARLLGLTPKALAAATTSPLAELKLVRTLLQAHDRGALDHVEFIAKTRLVLDGLAMVACERQAPIIPSGATTQMAAPRVSAAEAQQIRKAFGLKDTDPLPAYIVNNLPKENN